MAKVLSPDERRVRGDARRRIGLEFMRDLRAGWSLLDDLVDLGLLASADLDAICAHASKRDPFSGRNALKAVLSSAGLALPGGPVLRAANALPDGREVTVSLV